MENKRQRGRPPKRKRQKKVVASAPCVQSVGCGVGKWHKYVDGTRRFFMKVPPDEDCCKIEHVRIIGVELFMSSIPIKTMSDPRVLAARESMQWFEEWKTYVDLFAIENELSASDKNKLFLAHQTWHSLRTSFYSFIHVLEKFFETYVQNGDYFIVPNKFSTDSLELSFSWIRQFSSSLDPSTFASAVAALTLRSEVKRYNPNLNMDTLHLG